jgi:hypothetical protein
MFFSGGKRKDVDLGKAFFTERLNGVRIERACIRVTDNTDARSFDGGSLVGFR